MITYPCCKINLGLNVVSKREDGYHNLETVFYPIPLCDVLEIKEVDNASHSLCTLLTEGNELDCNAQDNLIVKAYNLIAKDYKLPSVKVSLEKRIPSQAGLGGGSSDAAFMIKLLNAQFNLNISIGKMEDYAARLGADCAFFIQGKQTFATGIGNIFTSLNTDKDLLKGYHIAIVKPDIPIPTSEAFRNIKPQHPAISCEKAILEPIENWKNMLSNDFEKSIFGLHPELPAIKNKLYELGATYAQMSGSGSSVFGIFKNEPENLNQCFDGAFTFTAKL